MTTRTLIRDFGPIELARAGAGGTCEETSQADFTDLAWEKLQGHMEALVRVRGQYPLMLDQAAEMLAVLVEILNGYPPQDNVMADLAAIMRAKELIHGGYGGAYVWTTED